MREEQAEPGGLTVRVEPWCDLVYHVLSHLPLGEGDASSLYDARYVRWSEERLGTQGAPPGMTRTLPQDAEMMARLYDASNRGYLLHALPSLWGDVDSFVRDVPTDFAALAWSDAAWERLAGSILEGVGAPLVELLRTALWSEWLCGYETVWHAEVRPRSEAYRATFVAYLEALAARLPVLHTRTWVLCHPLRTHGRVLSPSTVLVGVADEELGVGELDPILQACHEQLVILFQAVVPTGGDWATVPGRDGYEAFMEVEGAALTAGARLFPGSSWDGAYRVWLNRVFRGAGSGAVRRVLDGEFLTDRMSAALDDLSLETLR